MSQKNKFRKLHYGVFQLAGKDIHVPVMWANYDSIQDAITNLNAKILNLI